MADENEILAEGYKAISGKAYHASDCATSCAPAMRPGPCDCRFPAVGPWLPIEYYIADQHGCEVLICGGTRSYDAETFPMERAFNSVALASLEDGAWCGGYGSEYDGQYWHNPTHFMVMPSPAAQQNEEPVDGE